MKKALFSLLAVIGVLSAVTVDAYYNDNCSSANNYCGGTIYRCDIYCANGSYNYNYCNQNCNGWVNTYSPYNGSNNCYYDAWGTYRCDSSNYSYNTNRCYYDSWGTYRCDNTYSAYNYGTSNNCRYDGYGYYRCDTRAYPYWFPYSSWWWSQDDLNLMTQALNSDAIAAAKKPDFFESKITRKDNNWKKLNAITIGSYSLKTEDSKAKYEDSKKFIAALKDATWQRYSDGIIKNYQMADILKNLKDTVYHLNTYFSYTAQFERTGKSFYEDLAMEKLDDVKTNYDRLKASLRWRN